MTYYLTIRPLIACMISIIAINLLWSDWHIIYMSLLRMYGLICSKVNSIKYTGISCKYLHIRMYPFLIWSDSVTPLILYLKGNFSCGYDLIILFHYCEASPKVIKTWCSDVLQIICVSTICSTDIYYQCGFL